VHLLFFSPSLRCSAFRMANFYNHVRIKNRVM
jgi:hypothetical protein